jgi:hypothetical protein
MIDIVVLRSKLSEIHFARNPEARPVPTRRKPRRNVGVIESDAPIARYAIAPLRSRPIQKEPAQRLSSRAMQPVTRTAQAIVLL